MKKIKVGVVGAYRGGSMIKYCANAENAEVVAICDIRPELLKKQQKKYPEHAITYYTDFEEFLNHEMDAVVLANFANEHAPFAIKAMKAGKHVFSEVLPFQTMKEAVELIETVEETGMVYAYGENYCYMPGPYEMRKRYREGLIGEFEYGEGEYIHNCEPIWPEITYGDPDHWRNNMYATFYCTHSMGPLVHITGLRPVSVVGFESTMTARNLRCGAKAGLFGMELVTFENGAIAKSIHGGLYEDSIWYSVYGSKGRMETAREDAQTGDVKRLYVLADEYSGKYDKESKIRENDCPNEQNEELTKDFGHGGSDYYTMWHFAEKLRGNPEADIIDVYEACDMFLPGLFAYRSVLQGGIPLAIPDLRDPAVREQYRNDTACTDPKVAGDQLLPVFSKGNPDIPDEVYEEVKRKWEAKKK
ncbi:MAG: Gfo/Idh/MocA family oxidoreductase [Clostridia bacterium]|nr:Gfo/Idh/MocA family oxidoreductase [Clostridia bacterium]